jgi:hypothetical protein
MLFVCPYIHTLFSLSLPYIIMGHSPACVFSFGPSRPHYYYALLLTSQGRFPSVIYMHVEGASARVSVCTWLNGPMRIVDGGWGGRNASALI